MDAISIPDGQHLIEEAPVVPSWSDTDDASVVFLRPDPPVTLLLSIDTSKNTAVFRIRVPFQVDSIHNCLYALVDPGDVSAVHVSPLTTAVPEPVRRSLVGKGSSHDLVRMDFQLDKPPTVVGPSGATRLYPRGKPGGNILASLRSLTSTRALSIFITSEGLQLEHLSNLVNKDAGLQARTRHYKMEMLYEGRGGKEISELLSPFTLRSAHSAAVSAIAPDIGPARTPGEEPPAYDEVQPGPPRLSPALSGSPRAGGKRRASRENSGAPSPKKLPAAAVVSPSPPSELVRLRAEIDQLRKQIQSPSVVPGTPTEDGHILDRLDALENRVRTLEVQNRSVTGEEFRQSLLESLVPRLLEDIQPLIDKRLDDCTHDWIARHVEKEVDEQYDSAAHSLEILRDDLEEAIRDKIASAVHDNLSDVVSEQLPDTVDDRLEEVIVSVVERSYFTMHTPR
ncbi:hypothetical protein B0J12DRAFT_745751 [Macrophomina phaseolina]|uniref:Uncharacterized protein n=1 Tax=Macrophomina phaseolina TaxID=35725 RepID=A0ABQ8FVL3_9PEZI|nr:hypothetical protein B0J12DRAFT_745751 [Macrophomina phaseolina]